MSSNMEERKKPQRVIFGIIAFLLFLLVVESGVLIHKLNQPKSEKTQQLPNREPVYFPQTPAARTPFYGRPSTQLGSPAHREAWEDPWDPFFDDALQSLRTMQDRMNQMFGNLPMQGSPLGAITPSIDLEETPEAYIVRADLPGLEKDKIHISVQNNLLTLQGIRESRQETTNKDQNYYAQETSYGSFARTITLPGPVDETKITAKYADGVLHITLPKLRGEEAESKKITVQ